MKIYKYMVITKDDKTPLKKYQTITGARQFVKKLIDTDRARVKIVKIGNFK